MLQKSLIQLASKDFKSSRYRDICRSHISKAGVVMVTTDPFMVYRVGKSRLPERNADFCLSYRFSRQLWVSTRAKL